MAESIYQQLLDEGARAEHAVASWFHHPAAAPQNPYPSAAVAAAPDPTPTPEGPSPAMLEELKRLLDVADESSLHAINAVLTHPEGLAVLADVAAVAGIHVPAGTITAAASGLKAVLAVAGQTLTPTPA